MTAAAELPVLELKVDAAGTRLRLRALAAMGHSNERIGRALGQPAWLVTKITNLSVRTVTPELRADVCRLFDAWWDKRPPETTAAESRAAAAARARARRGSWCTGLALDDEHVDTPGYRPRAGWLPATGTGVAVGDPLGWAVLRDEPSRTELAGY
jgi:hypothetical protein